MTLEQFTIILFRTSCRASDDVPAKSRRLQPLHQRLLEEGRRGQGLGGLGLDGQHGGRGDQARGAEARVHFLLPSFFRSRQTPAASTAVERNVAGAAHAEQHQAGQAGLGPRPDVQRVRACCPRSDRNQRNELHLQS